MLEDFQWMNLAAKGGQTRLYWALEVDGVFCFLDSSDHFSRSMINM